MGLRVYLLLHESCVELLAMLVRTHRLYFKQLYDSQKSADPFDLKCRYAWKWGWGGVTSDQMTCSICPVLKPNL